MTTMATATPDSLRAALRKVIEREKPNVVFHAAAYKHVPLMEETNAWQAVRNNAYGTWVIARASVAAKVEKFVLVSTDKAVNPTSVMGASKRLAEIVCQTLQGGGTAFVVVRFGNVRRLDVALRVVLAFRAGPGVPVAGPEEHAGEEQCRCGDDDCDDDCFYWLLGFSSCSK